MPASTIVMGMVLSAMPVGDYDKRLVILTKELGKITAFAKGARRPNSALLASAQPFSFGEFTLYAGRNSYNIMSVEISNYFEELREDFEAVTYGFYFCEFVDYITKENIVEVEILKLLYQSLRALAKNTIERELIRVIFELRMMALSGESPQVFECVKCGGEAAVFRFSIESGGLLCEACKGIDIRSMKLSTSTIYTMQYIMSKGIEQLYTFKVTEEVLQQLRYCMKRYLECYIDHKFKSMELIEALH